MSGHAQGDRQRIAAALATVALGLALFGLLVSSAVAAYHFHRHAVIVDARILDSDLGCFGASGSGSTPSGDRSSITYDVQFAVAGSPYRTSVKRPCGVIPPDFGRGRGSIWVEYDREDPERVRVLNDHRAETDTRTLSLLFGAYAAGLVGWAVTRAVVQKRGGRRSG